MTDQPFHPPCEHCGLVPSAVKIEVQESDGETRTRALCWGCVAQLSAQLSLDPGREEKVCPLCRTTWKSFRKNRRLGCPECYKTFEEDLKTWLVKKDLRPLYTGPGPRPQQELRRLEGELARALREERYEDAASLRDQLRRLAGDPL